MSRKTRKLIWSAPLVAVLAVAGALAMVAAQGPGSVFADPLPGAPMNLKVEAASGDAGRTTLVLTWDAPSGGNVTGYRIDKSDRGAVWESLVTDTGSAATTHMDSDDLTADDVRWYRVFALNSHDVGSVSNAISGKTDTKASPGSVMNLRAVPNAKNPRGAIDLIWDPPADNGGEKIVGYEVQFHNGSEWGNLTDAAADTPVTFTTNNVTAVTKTQVTDGDLLDPGDSRLYRVRAINGPGTFTAAASVAANTAEDTASKEWTRRTGTTSAATNPGPVTGLTAVNTDADQIDLYWYAPEDNGGWDISGYLIQARRVGKDFPPIPSDDVLTTTANTVTLGSSTNPDNANRFIPVPAAGITQVSFEGIANTLDTDADGNGDAQERWYFRVFALTTDDGPDNTPGTDDVIRRSRTPSNTASDVAMLRFDADDDTPIPAVDPWAAPTIDPTGSVGESDHEKQKITLELTLADTVSSAGLTQIGYRIDYSKDAGLTWKLLERDTRFTRFGEDLPYVDDKDLGFDEARHYRVFAIGRNAYADVGPPSTLSDGSTAPSAIPGAPTGVMASSPSLTSIMAEWTAPKDDGGKPIVKYYYQYATDDGDSVAEVADFTVGASAVFATDDAMTMGTFTVPDPLSPETVYVFQMAAVNLDSAGEDRPLPTATGAAINWSEGVLFNTSGAAKPNAVEGLTSDRATDASGDERGVNLLWNKPSDDIDITAYDVEVLNDAGEWVNPTNGETLSARQTSYTDSIEPKADEVRKYRVRATNGVGDGRWTEINYPRDPGTHEHNAAPMDVGSIAAQSVAAEESVTIDVAANFSDANMDDTLTYTAESSMTDIATVAVSGSIVTITGVAEGSAVITVTATDDDGETATQSFMVTVTAAMLTAPTGVMANAVARDGDPGVYDVVVIWTPGQGATQHAVILFDLDFNFDPATDLATNQDSGDTTFRNVASGDYIAVVAALDADFEMQIGFAMVTVQ